MGKRMGEGETHGGGEWSRGSDGVRGEKEGESRGREEGREWGRRSAGYVMWEWPKAPVSDRPNRFRKLYESRFAS